MSHLRAQNKINNDNKIICFIEENLLNIDKKQSLFHCTFIEYLK